MACGHYIRVTTPLGWEENSKKSSLPHLSFPLWCILSCGSETMSFPGSLLSYAAFCINPIFDCNRGTKSFDMKSCISGYCLNSFSKESLVSIFPNPHQLLNHPAYATTSPFLSLNLHFPSEFLISSFYKP